MKPKADYVALHDVQIPNSYAFAARTGDELTADVAENLGLVVGLDITPLRADVVPEPDADADRLAWQAYAVQVGVPYAEASLLDLKDLKSQSKKYAADAGKQAEVAASVGVMPEASAPKAAWVEYAAAELAKVGADPEFARQHAADHTKADLITALGPDATEQTRGDFLAAAGDAEGSAQPTGPVVAG